MDEQITKESAGGGVICDHYEYDAIGRLISHWQSVETGGLFMYATTHHVRAAPILVEPQPPAFPSCPACRGTGRVMLLVRSKECEKCRGTGKGS
jgi:hypothetical protein